MCLGGYDYLYLQWKVHLMPDLSMFLCWDWEFNRPVPNTP